MVLAGGTTTTTATNMGAASSQGGFLAVRMQEETRNVNADDIASQASPGADYEFDESQCLFCNQTNHDVEQNLVHMSKSHGLHVDMTNLLVDVESLLAYFHTIISEYYECLYCGTQRNTRQAAQQHMMAKGHCKYDLTDEDAEARDFYDVATSNTMDELRMRYSDDPLLPSQTRLRKPRQSRSSEGRATNIKASSLDQTTPNSSPQSRTDAHSRSNTAETPSESLGELSTRALKQEHTLNQQLMQLRAGDRRSLVHLPAAQQRAILSTHHKQMEKARRTEQTQRGNLECAGNHFSRLTTIRLIRKPPHTGNIHSLNR